MHLTLLYFLSCAQPKETSFIKTDPLDSALVPSPDTTPPVDSSTEDTGPEPPPTPNSMPVDLYTSPQFVMGLYPTGESSGNVVQGIAVDWRDRSVWTSTDMGSNTEAVLINQLSLSRGVPRYCTPFEGNIELGHGQDLSLDYTSQSPILWTGSSSDMGVSKVNPRTLEVQSIQNLLPEGFSHSTPSMGIMGSWLGVRGSQNDDSESNDWIFIYDADSIRSALTGESIPEPLHSFNLNSYQRVENQWFQGLAIDEEHERVYVYTGNSDDSISKLLFVYSPQGELLEQHIVDIDTTLANTLGNGHYEPESLSLVRDSVTQERVLYFGLMFGSPGSRIKRLYAYGSTDNSLGGELRLADLNADWLLRYNTNTGEVSFRSHNLDHSLGCEVKRKFWTTGWSDFTAYRSGDNNFLFLNKSVDGSARIHPISFEASLGSSTKDDTWSDGWDYIESWEGGTEAYLFHYKSTNGITRVSQLDADGDTGTRIVDDTWLNGLEIQIIQSNTAAFLFRKNAQEMQIVPLRNTGEIGEVTDTLQWDSHWDKWLTVSDQDDILLARYRSDTGQGELHHLDIGTGQIYAQSSTLDWGLGWTHFWASTLETQPMLHMYNDQSGEYQPAEIHSNGGLSLGNIDLWEADWTHFLPFRSYPD